MTTLHVLICLLLSASAASATSSLQPDDCYVYDGKRAIYNGNHTISSGGRPCQNWSSSSIWNRSPHVETKTNYCRDPDGSGYTWCWTRGGKEACNISHCPRSPDQEPALHRCYVYNPVTQAALYEGFKAITMSGKKCLRWDLGGFGIEDDFYLKGFHNLKELVNYCRDPDAHGSPWCYVSTFPRKWEECDVSYCTGPELPEGALDLTQCYVTQNSGETLYLGNESVTVSGKTCQAWREEHPHMHTYYSPFSVYFPHLVKNFCRALDESIPWCYTTSPDTRWEFCPVPRCEVKEGPTLTAPSLDSSNNGDKKNPAVEDHASPGDNLTDALNDQDGPQLSGTQPASATIIGLMYLPTGLGFVTLIVVLLVYWRKSVQLDRELERDLLVL